MPLSDGAGATDQSKDSALSTPGQSASPSTLAGMSGDDSGASPNQTAQPDGDEGLKQAVQQVRQIQMQVMDMAKQFPAASGALRSVATGLRAALRDIIANPGAPEPPAPSIGG
jgi:hypothetical protein